MGYPKLKRAVAEQWRAFNPSVISIEDKASWAHAETHPAARPKAEPSISTRCACRSHYGRATAPSP